MGRSNAIDSRKGPNTDVVRSETETVKRRRRRIVHRQKTHREYSHLVYFIPLELWKWISIDSLEKGSFQCNFPSSSNPLLLSKKLLVVSLVMSVVVTPFPSDFNTVVSSRTRLYYWVTVYHGTYPRNLSVSCNPLWILLDSFHTWHQLLLYSYNQISNIYYLV